MKMIKVWIVPEMNSLEVRSYMKNNPATFIFPKKDYMEAIYQFEFPMIGEEMDFWYEKYGNHLKQIKACQNLALRLLLEKEVENG